MTDQSDIDAVTFGPSDLPLEYLDFFEMTSGKGKAREVMLAVFRSDLGSALNLRAIAPEEARWVRETVAMMVRLAAATEAGLPDDYFVELVDGEEEDFRTIPPTQRAVFSLENDNWQNGELAKVEIS